MWKAVCVMPVLVLTGACSSMLPVSHSDASSFQSFEQARDAVVALVPMKTTRSMAENGAVDFAGHPNTKMLTHSDIVRMLVPAGVLKREDLDPGIIVCLEARDACTGLEITASKIAKTRTGNFFADLITYKQRTETKGWRFNALILYVDDLVVYRSWGGQPKVDELDVATRPLGPFQEMGPSLVSAGH